MTEDRKKLVWNNPAAEIARRSRVQRSPLTLQPLEYWAMNAFGITGAEFSESIESAFRSHLIHISPNGTSLEPD